MWWRELRPRSRPLARLAVVIAAASFTAGCWEPLYSTRPAVNSESVQDKFAAIEIPPIIAPKGTPVERVAVGMFNALQFDLHNGAGAANAPIYRLVVNVGSAKFTAVTDPNSGRPDAQVESLNASYQLIEIVTGKAVVSDSTFAHVDYDIPGPQQRRATPKTVRSRLPPRPSGTGSLLTSLPAPEAFSAVQAGSRAHLQRARFAAHSALRLSNNGCRQSF
jgi:LPS-assembly lipoprotein